MLRVNEARDLGESGRVDRYGLYEHCKHILATPPTTMRVNEKYVREYYIENVIGMIITTNYRDALYLPYDDRRHYVAFSECKASEFADDYWPKFWSWYHHEDGFAHVAAYLHAVDLSGFDPKASPRKTAAFLAMADSGSAPEEADLRDRDRRHRQPAGIDARTIRQRTGWRRLQLAAGTQGASRDAALA